MYKKVTGEKLKKRGKSQKRVIFFMEIFYNHFFFKIRRPCRDIHTKYEVIWITIMEVTG